MTPIRTFRDCVVIYEEIFLDEVGGRISSKEIYEMVFASPCQQMPDATAALTFMREKLVEHGFAKEVEIADKLFLEQHRGFNSDEEFEAFWLKYADNWNMLEKYKDAI